MSTPPHAVYFLPWLNLRSVLSIGPVTFWPYYPLADERIADVGIKIYLDKLFGSFLDRGRNPVRTITICSYEGIDFQLFTPRAVNHLTWAINSLMLAAITEPLARGVITDNQHNAPPSANIFELRFQGFGKNTDEMTFRAGSVTHFGLPFGEFFFAEPWRAVECSSHPADDYLRDSEAA